MSKANTPAATRELFTSLIIMNSILCLLASMLLDGGTISRPAVFFFSGTIIYLLARLLIYRFSPNGYPVLTNIQRYALILLPFYGFPLTFAIWSAIRTTFFKE